MLRRVINRLSVLSALLSCSLIACESQPQPSLPPNFVVSARQPQAWPRGIIATTSAPPQIVRIWLSGLAIKPGSTLDGAIATSTNVASVEVRTAAFSINSSHVAPGQFRFHTRVLELPPLARRHTYILDVIARNTAGVQQVEHARLTME